MVSISKKKKNQATIQEWLLCKNDIPMRILLALNNHQRCKSVSFTNLCDEAGIGKTRGRIYLKELEKVKLISKDNFHLHSARISLTKKGSIVAKNLFELQQCLKT